MSVRFRLRPLRPLMPAALTLATLAGLVTAAGPAAAATAGTPGNWPVTNDQRSTAHKVAEAGVPLSELAADAPDSYTVKRGDTLWAISKLFLKSPWRWPELWGMNLEQIRNPHLIYPGQVLVLEKSGGRARLKLANPVSTTTDTVKLQPKVRSESSEFSAIASIPMNLIGPFLNDAAIFETNELDTAPRIVATPEQRVLLAKGDLAYVRGDTAGQRSWQIFRAAKPVVDPATNEILGFEGRFVGAAERVRDGESRPGAVSDASVPTTFRVISVREEAGVGDRLTPAAVRDFAPFVPHSPENELNGQIAALYGDALSAGQNQIVALNRGKRDGVERGHVLALWQSGRTVVDSTDPSKPAMKLPDERRGVMFVFRVFERVSYALILSADDPAHVGDHFSKP